MTTLNDVIKDKKPIKVFIQNDITGEFEYYETMEYNKDLKRYECNFGNIPLKKIPLILSGKINHIKLGGEEK